MKKGLSDWAFGIAAWVYRVYVCRGGDRLLSCVLTRASASHSGEQSGASSPGAGTASPNARE